MIETRAEEHLHLDFKTVGKDDMSLADDRRNLASAISGFANSDGGIVVWGVVTKQGGDRIDCASEARPVASPLLLVTRLNDLTGEATSPTVAGVEHRALVSPQDEIGFVATLVPPSERAPHMALGKEHRYYKRSGSAFYRMEHFDIADMFGRRASPVLEVTAETIEGGGTSGGGNRTFEGRTVLSIRNIGRASARAPYLSVRIESGHKASNFGIDGNGYLGLPRQQAVGTDPSLVYAGTTIDILHPGTTREIMAIQVTAAQHGGRTLVPPQALRLTYGVAAEGLPLSSGTISITQSELARIIIPADVLG